MEWGKIGSFGGILLAVYLLILGCSALFGMTNIPPWFMPGILATGAGLLILIGK